MRFSAVLSFFVLAAVSSFGLNVGDTYDDVIAEKGEPTARLQAGETLVLNYPDQRIKLKSGKVVEVNSKLPAAARPVEPEPPAANGPLLPAGVWTTDYKAALAQARTTQMKVFLFFTGSDWCGWCKRLDREILSTPQFLAYAKKNLILVKLDFPRSFVLTDDVKNQNDGLARLYQVDGFPTVVVLDSRARLAGRLGYQEGGPGPFIEALGKP